MRTYYRLLDKAHLGQIIKCEGNNEFFKYKPGTGWVESSLIIHYLWIESDTFGKYEVISEEEALGSVVKD